jgi:hypothetical protein
MIVMMIANTPSVKAFKRSGFIAKDSSCERKLASQDE